MKRILLMILVVSALLLGACGAPAMHTLSVTISPSGAGAVSPPGGDYESGLEVTLSATAASGYAFDYWDGAASGSSATITITMDSNKSITAHFKAQYTLTTSVSPDGAGTVSPASGTYDEGTEVILTAEPASGYGFDSWDGDVSGSSNPIAITLNSDKMITAIFVSTVAHYELRVTNGRCELRPIKVPSEVGGIGIRIGGLSVGIIREGAGKLDFPSGVSITLVANPSPGYEFDHWSGDVSGTSLEITVDADSDMDIFANFTKID